MATKQEAQAQKPEPLSQPANTTPVVMVESEDVSDLFKRQVNSASPVRQLRLKSILTRPLISMAKVKTAAVKCETEMYLMDLPLKGRKGGNGPCRVIDVHQPQTGEVGILVIHEVIESSLRRAGFRTLTAKTDVDGNVTYSEHEGKSLIGHMFGLVAGEIEAEKRHRTIAVAEIE